MWRPTGFRGLDEGLPFEGSKHESVEGVAGGPETYHAGGIPVFE